MKIKYLSGPKAGQEEHVPNDVGRFGIASGLAELVGESDAPVKGKVVTADSAKGKETYVLPTHGSAPKQTPAWEVTTYHGVDRKFLAIKFSIGQREEFYSGPPDRIRRIGGWVPPQAIIAEYAKQYRAYPELRDTLSVQLASVNQSAATANDRASTDKKYFDNAVKDGHVPFIRPIALD